MRVYFRAIISLLAIAISLYSSLSFAQKPVLVLFPVEVDQSDHRYFDDYGSALQEGLQTRYKVFYGPAVEAELEKEYDKADCNAELCNQNVAIAFNTELIAHASARRLGDGYILKLVTTNIFTDEIVESQTHPCRGCDGFAVIDAFKAIGRGQSVSQNTALNSQAGSIKVLNSNNNTPASSSNIPAILLFDSKPSGAAISINGKAVGTTPYQGLSHVMGESLAITLSKAYYQPLDFKVTLNKDVTRLAPQQLAQGQAEVLVSYSPYTPGASLQIGDKNHGELPLKLALAAGEHDAIVVHQGKTLTNQRVLLNHGDSVHATLSAKGNGKALANLATIPAKLGILLFDSTPSGASVSINGKAMGITPYQGFNFKQGQTVKVELTKSYYQSLLFETRLAAELTRLPNTLALQQGQGSALFALEPYSEGATLWVNGEQRGELPLRLNLAAGNYKVEAKVDAKVVAALPVEVTHGSNQTVALKQGLRRSGSGSGEVFRDCDNCPEMVVVPAGSFEMGSNSGGDNEKPAHTVTIANDFAVGRYEVTFDEWDACVSAGGCSHKPSDKGWGKGNRPVMNVSWKDAQTYIKWLSKKTGKTYRLLSEAEWEYAARAGSTTKYSWGNSIDCSKARYYSSQCVEQKSTDPVGSFKANAFGLYDMHGNVWEWVEDCWNNSYKKLTRKAPSDGSAWLKGECDKRVLRGGSWANIPAKLRSAFRSRNLPAIHIYFYGFRLAQDL